MRGRAIRRTAGRLVVVVAALGVSTSRPAANPESDALRVRAYELAYNLDHEEALETFRRAVQADPADPATHRGVALVTWLNLLFRRGAVTVDHYLGSLSRPDVTLRQPPPELASAFRSNLERATQLAEQQVTRNPRDVNAHYELGAAVGLMATYAATVEGKVLAGFKAARRAYNEHETVLSLAAERKDAALTVGTYRYLVSSFSLPMRMLAYVAGFGGGRERGIEMLKEAAAFRSDARTEARFALILIFNREKRYAEATAVMHELERAYPRNRLLWLEEGSTALRAGQPEQAETALAEGMAMLARDTRPRAFGEEALWHYKRGAAQVLLKHPDAGDHLRAALRTDARDWVRGRAHLELGKLADLAGDRGSAESEYTQAMASCERDSDPAGASEAARLRRSPYR